MMSEGLEKLGFSPADIYLESLVDSKEGLILLVRGGKGDFRAKVIFEHPRAYRNIDEGDYLNMEENRKYDGQGLYKTAEASFIDWFHRVSVGVYENEGMQQYSLYTCDDCVEVLSAEDPDIVIE